MVHWTRYLADPRDPDYVEPPVLCPNPECEGGEVSREAARANGQLLLTCHVCQGDAQCWANDVADWAEARGIELVVDEDWIYAGLEGNDD
jgi:hypothetical protein